MTLKNLIDVLGSGEQIRIATLEGQNWIINTTVIHFDECQEYNMLVDRIVENVYTSEGRDATIRCCALTPAICIIVSGYENGSI